MSCLSLSLIEIGATPVSPWSFKVVWAEEALTVFQTQSCCHFEWKQDVSYVAPFYMIFTNQNRLQLWSKWLRSRPGQGHTCTSQNWRKGTNWCMDAPGGVCFNDSIPQVGIVQFWHLNSEAQARFHLNLCKAQVQNLPISTRPHCLKVVSGCFEQKQERSTKSRKTEANKEAWVIWAEAKRTKPGSGLTCSLWSLVNFDRFVGSLYNFESWTWLSPNICERIECKNSEVQKHIQALYSYDVTFSSTFNMYKDV